MNAWRRVRLYWILAVGLWLTAAPGLAQTVAAARDGPTVPMYFFWSITCPHCTEAHPHVLAIPDTRPWVELHALELSRHPANLARFEEMARAIGQPATSVPAFIFCGEMHVGWQDDATTGAFLRQRLDACRSRRMQAGAVPSASPADVTGIAPTVRLPGGIDPGQWSLPALTLILAGLDAFNPCAFFVLLFLLSMLTHQRDRRRMALIGGVFVLVSGFMYFAFMAAWLNVFQLFGHLAWVTLAAGVLAVLVGLVNIKDYFLFGAGPSLSIPAAGKADLFRRVRGLLDAERLPAMLTATLFLAIAANFYELLCTAGFPMVYTRMLTLAEPSPAARYAYLAAYNLIYVTPLALIVWLFTRTLGARKLSEREGRLLKLLSGLMMLGLGSLLLIAPQLISRAGVAFALMAIAVGITWLAARRNTH